MHIAIDKTRDQDPPCNRRKHPPHSVLTYKEKNPTNHTYNHVEVKQFVVEGKGKKKKKNPHEIEIHLYAPVQMMGENR